MIIRRALLGAFCLGPAMAAVAPATVISGAITAWPESGPVIQVGDGTNHVSMWWSINTWNLGWFYGSTWTTDSDVAYASGATNISQISDASTYTYTNAHVGPYGDADHNANGIGSFLVWKHTTTGHYGALRVDDIYQVDPNNPNPAWNTELNGTWWFQTDGTGDFSSVPEPATLAVLGIGALALLRRRT